MIPTTAEVYTATRFLLGDTKVTGGQIFTDAFLAVYFPSAYMSLFRWLERNGNKLVRRTQYFNLPANTSYITPAGMYILNMGEPLEIYDRPVGDTITGMVATFNAASLGVPPSLDLTAASHGLTAGAQVVTFGFGIFTATSITADANDQWYIDVPNANTIRLLGCGAVDLGNGIGSTGIVSTGSGDFPTVPLNQAYDISQFPSTASNGQLSTWMWQGDAIRFIPATAARQIKVVYSMSGKATEAQLTGSIGIDDSLDALSTFLAAACAQAKGFNGIAQNLFMRAVGNPTGDTTNIQGGAFYELAQLGLKQINKTRIVVGRYRRKRNVGPAQWAW